MNDPIKLFEGIYQKRKLHIWSKISRRELWGDDLRFPEGRLMEDVAVTIKHVCAGNISSTAGY